MRPHGPAVAKWQLGRQLSMLCDDKAMSVKDVAGVIDCSESKVYKILKGETNISRSDLIVLLGKLGITGDQHAAMLDLQKQGKQRGWWASFAAKLPSPLVTYISYESEATLARMFEPTMVPGILQTREYAEQTIFGVGREEAQRRVDVRMARQERLHADTEEAITVRVVIDEAVIRRKVGGNEVMRAQLEHLLQLMELPNVHLQVLPFELGSYPATAGPFTVLEFPDNVHSPVVYAEHTARDSYLEESDEVKRCSLIHEDCQSSALSPPESRRLIAEQLKALA